MISTFHKSLQNDIRANLVTPREKLSHVISNAMSYTLPCHHCHVELSSKPKRTKNDSIWELVKVSYLWSIPKFKAHQHSTKKKKNERIDLQEMKRYWTLLYYWLTVPLICRGLHGYAAAPFVLFVFLVLTQLVFLLQKGTICRG